VGHFGSNGTLVLTIRYCGGTSCGLKQWGLYSEIELADGFGIASLEEKIPTRDRASVRICESMVSGPAMTSYTDALEFTSAAMQELTEADDPKGMFNALAFALIEFGDASAVADDAAYQTAAMNLANVCVDIVSGEYGK